MFWWENATGEHATIDIDTGVPVLEYPGSTRVRRRTEPLKKSCSAANTTNSRPVRMLHQADPKGAGERPASGRPRELQARLLHACLLSAAALLGVDAQFASPDANCSFASFATRLQAREACTIPSLAAAYAAAPLERSTPLKSSTLAIAAGRQRIPPPAVFSSSSM